MDLTSGTDWLTLLLGAALLIWVFVIARRLSPRRRAERAREEERQRQAEAQAEEDEKRTRLIVEWGDKIKAAGHDHDKIVAIEPPPDGAEQYFKKIKYSTYYSSTTPYDIYQHVGDWERERAKLLARYERDDPFSAIAVLDEVNSGTFPHTPSAEFVFGVGASRSWLQDQYDEKVADLVSRIMEADRGPARRMFKKLREKLERRVSLAGLVPIFKAQNPNYQDDLKANLPEEWNDLVAMFVRTPKLEDFSPSALKLNEAEALQLATQAVRERSLTKAKLSLAYAAVERHEWGGRHRGNRVWFPYREMLGDQLVGELSALVEDLHGEQGLFTGKSKKSTSKK